ncbi:MAG: hypothetical protein P1V51_13475 [Deltaproteobacteria bacterium]|nr:hypothetical protein [Deltaproteobacteria bacterium]
MRSLLVLLALPSLLAAPALATPEPTPLVLLPIHGGEGVSAAELTQLERELRESIAGLRHFRLIDGDQLEPLGAPCRADLGCVRASLPAVRGRLILDLRVERLGKVLAVDLRLVEPAGPIERWRSTLSPRRAPATLGKAVTTLLQPHAPDLVLYRWARAGGDAGARNRLLRDYPDSAYARALLRPAPATAPAVAEEEAAPGEPDWLGAIVD